MNIPECSKTILSKVSFDAELLEKELGKTIGNITHDEEPGRDQ
jgi:hypothetical protein